jgi:hypothetical protein
MTTKVVLDGKLSNEQLGAFARRTREIERRLNEGTLAFPHVMEQLQSIIEGTASSFGIFNPESFIGRGWSIAEDREDLPADWNPSITVLVSALKNNESRITGDEMRTRLANKPLLGVKAFWHYWNNQADIPVEWKGKHVFFDATVLQSPDGGRDSLFLYWRGDRWGWSYGWLVRGRDSVYLSACACT